MSARIHLILALALIAAGSIVLTIATGSPPPEFQESWLDQLFAGVALIAAGLGVFAAMFASALLGLLRIHRAERAAGVRAADQLVAAAEASRAPLSSNGHRTNARGQRPR